MIYVAKPYIGEEEKQAVMAVLESGMLAQGQQVAALEETFAARHGVKHGIATTSGTTALQVAMLAHGIGPGDEVITTAFTFIATVNAILYTGARPVFVDIRADTFNIDPDLIEAAITPATRAIMPVHLYGLPADMDAIMAIAEKHGLAVIEDAAQAVGATYKGRPIASFGTGCFSLYATKNVMSGEGGMIVTNDDALADAARLIRNHGMRKRYHYERLGFNFRLSDLHAAIGNVQMTRLDDFNACRRRNAAFLDQHLTSVITPPSFEGYDHVYHQYTVRCEGDRDAAIEQLREGGVGVGVFYPIPAHHHGYVGEVSGPFSLPVTELVSTQVFSLPVHPQLSEDELNTIVREVNKL